MRTFISLIMLLFLAAQVPALAAGPGEKLYEEFKEKEQIYPDEAWQNYVQKVGDRLVSYSSGKGREFHFTVLDNPVVNAFALPDGYIFVNRGLLAYLDTEDQLAGVIGHEIGHVVRHHARRQGTGRTLGKVAGFIGAVLTGRGEVADLANTASATLVSGYGRNMELEADTVGGELLAKAGYNPFAMIEVVQVLKDQETFSVKVANQRQSYHGLFASHPKNDKRLHDAVAQSEGVFPAQLEEPIGNYMEMVNGLVFGDEAATGVVRDNTFFHGALRLVVVFPEGWDVSNSAKRVMGRDPAGASVGFITFERQNAPEDEKMTPKAYITDVLKRDDLLDGGEELEVDGNPAYIGSLSLEGGQAVQKSIAILFKDGGTYMFKGEAGAAGDVESFKEKFKATVSSLRELQPGDLRTANKQRIKVIVAEPGDTYESLAASSSIKRMAAETLRLINGDYPIGEPRAGDEIKTVQ